MSNNIPNNNLTEAEQAAGFAPYTRGYNEFNFETNVIVIDQNNTYDFELTDFSDAALCELFQSILTKNTSQKTIHLLLKTPITAEIVSATKTLRTLLALVNQSQKNNPSFSKFCFHITGEVTKNLFIEYHFIKASQIDFFELPENAIAILQNLPKNQTPIDPLYQNSFFEKKINEQVETVWNIVYQAL